MKYLMTCNNDIFSDVCFYDFFVKLFLNSKILLSGFKFIMQKRKCNKQNSNVGKKNERGLNI